MERKRCFTRTMLALVLSSMLSACSLFETIQAEHVVAATVLATPAYDFNAALQLPTGTPPVLPTVPAQTIAQVFFGKRANATDLQNVAGVPGAVVTLTCGTKTFRLADKGQGNYFLSTVDNAEFVYQPGVVYKLTITQGGEEFTGTVTSPQPERIEQFHTQGSFPLRVGANQELSLTRASTDNVAFTTVAPATSTSADSVTYTDFPTEPLDLLDLIANDARWKQKVIKVPGKAFPQAASYYVVSVSAVEQGETSDNLFTASGFLVGTADVGLVQTN